jgi:hypothetical protein
MSADFSGKKYLKDIMVPFFFTDPARKQDPE